MTSRIYCYPVPEVVAMGDEDTVVLTPEEKEKILKDVPDDEQQDDEDSDD